MFIYLLLPSCEGKYKERAKTWELNISFRLVNHKIIFSSRETLAETLFTGRWRQTDNSASLWSRFSPVGQWTAAQGGVGTSCDYRGNNPEPCMESHLKKLSICTPKIRNQMSKGKTLTGNLMVNILLSLISNTLCNRVTTAFHTDDPRSTQTVVCRM